MFLKNTHCLDIMLLKYFFNDNSSFNSYYEVNKKPVHGWECVIEPSKTQVNPGVRPLNLDELLKM